MEITRTPEFQNQIAKNYNAIVQTYGLSITSTVLQIELEAAFQKQGKKMSDVNDMFLSSDKETRTKIAISLLSQLKDDVVRSLKRNESTIKNNLFKIS